MGMTIDEIIQGIEVIKAQAEWEYPLDWQIVLDGAIDTMRKYQKIEQIVTEWNKYRQDISCGFGDGVYMQMVGKVVEDERPNV